MFLEIEGIHFLGNGADALQMSDEITLELRNVVVGNLNNVGNSAGTVGQDFGETRSSDLFQVFLDDTVIA